MEKTDAGTEILIAYSEIKTLFELEGVFVSQSDVIGFVFLQKSTLVFAVQHEDGKA